MFDIYEQLGKNAENYSDEDIIKAIVAGSQTGRDLTDTLSSGPSLKPESLDPVVKVLENKENHIVLWKLITKKSVYNTVHEYNQLVSYGADVGIFMNEGESPEQTDSVYRRKAAMVKYAGIQGELTQQSMLVRQTDGKDPYTREVENKTMKLLTQLDEKLSSSNDGVVTQAFKGIFQQHYTGILEITASANTAIDTYWNDVTNIDVRGEALKDSNVEDAVQAVVNDRFGTAAKIISNPVVFNDYVKRFHESKRVMVNSPKGATEGATMGQKVNDIMTQFGKIDVVNDIFFDRRVHKVYNSAAISTKAPAKPTAVDNTCLTIVSADTKTKFGDGNGTYIYGVTSKNQYGESAMTLCNTTPKAIGTTESLDIVFTSGAGTYPETGYVIYRSLKNATDYTTALLYPIFEVSITDLSNGYDGATNLAIRDRNRVMGNTHSALVMDITDDMWEYIQLAATMKIDFAITTLSRRFAVVNYGTPLLYMPGKISVIHNIGRTITTTA